MTVTRTFLGPHPDTGQPWFHYASDGHVVLTGPASGDVTLDDGTVVAVDAPVVELDTLEQAQEVAHLVALQHEETGALNVSAEESPTGEPIVFTHNEADCVHCSKEGK